MKIISHFACSKTRNDLPTAPLTQFYADVWFPEYRAELYWRLENKRMKKLSKENTPCNGKSVDPNNNVDHGKSKVVSEEVSKYTIEKTK